MTGPEHYREAERLTEQSKTWANADMGRKAHLSSEERIAYRMADLAEAQVHATLAQAAATAMSGTESGGMARVDFNAWDGVAGVPLSGDDD
ncbi:hypothetical protein [Streptomyces sp. NBC_00582]|uniref:hypothetical protein n=1 Tax=Streptomyces sp. NBC_00582 TaxID=2975783 RepID=UPI002E809D7F|nr:hypothetical protein [Streptomyces sp. NBC_00582]WUB63849.1 hypothetical protein OG852_27385 [Streptomyces sp. NBC_00582]